MKKFLLFGAAFALALATVQAQAQTLDPLHGYTFSGGVPTNNDNGTDTPLNGTTNFGFFASPAPQTGDLILAILTPNNDPSLASITVTGTFAGSGSLLAGQWTTGNLATFINGDGVSLPGVSPPNPLGTWPEATGQTGYDVDTINLGTQTLNSLMANITGPAMTESLTSSLPLDSIIVAFLVEGNSTVATASSGGLLVNTAVATTPLPGAAWLMAGGLGFLGFVSRRKRKPPTSVLA